MIVGLVGEELIHSFSKEIHEKISSDEYKLISLNEDELKVFFEKKNFQGVNVTIPYKQTVIKYLDEIELKAKKIGAINLVVNKDGLLKGYNTDYIGFKKLLERNNVEIKGKRCLILGSGGTSKTIFNVLRDLDAFIIAVASRNPNKKMISYEDLHHQKFDIIINATPVGMFPKDEAPLIDVKVIKDVTTVVDVIYNPLRTRLMIDALDLKIKAVGGIRMLVEQAFYSHELMFDTTFDEALKDEIVYEIYNSKLNIALIGLAGSGKTSIAKELGKLLTKEVLDTDLIIEKETNRKIADIINIDKEEEFRKIEAKVIKQIKQTASIISTGGGAVLNHENMNHLRSNSLVFYIKRDINKINLDFSSHPLSPSLKDLKQLEEKRSSLYEKYADFVIDNNQSISDAVNEIIEKYQEYIKKE